MARILQVNKFFYNRGGSETYLFLLRDLLESNGNQIIDFSMEDERNFPSPFQKYFVSHIDYNKQSNLLDQMKMATKIIYSREARKKVTQLIDDSEPDIAHLHVFQHQLSLSIIMAFKQRKIPIVYTAHDLKAICPNYKMFSQQRICEDCKQRRYYRCVVNKCVKKSHFKSLVNALEMYMAYFFKIYDLIDVIITPSRFYRQKLIEFGFDPEKVVHIPNFVDINCFVPSYDNDNYFIYLGRLVEEKGLLTLLKAMKFVHGAKLIIIGDGPIQSELKKIVVKEGLQERIEIVGFKQGTELEELVKFSMFAVVPSEWYENGPYSVLEMMARGKPVIGSNIGGIPELIEDGRTGLVFETGNVNQLAEKINTLVNNSSLIKEYGKNARECVEKLYCKENHYVRIFEIYQKLISGKNRCRF